MTSVSSANPSIRPRQLQDLSVQGHRYRLIDVRTPAEFHQVHADGAINVPLDTLDPTKLTTENGISPNETLYVICKMGGRSQKACIRMQAAGFSNVINVDGGTDEWVAENLPAVRGSGKSVISIQRQVQLVAGSLVLCGALLSFANPWFALLAAAIGAGLVFSGITDTCGMGTCLAKMPWNQAPKPNPLEIAAACDSGG